MWRRSLSFSTFIHKLPFGVTPGVITFKISALDAIVEDLYHEIKVDTNSTIAYKDRHYERDLSAKLNIPSLNLEWFDCPKAEKLFDQLVGNLWETPDGQRALALP